VQIGTGCRQVGPYLVGHGFDYQRRGGLRLRWSRADTLPSSANARGGRATPAYSSANEGCYSDPCGYRVAYAFRYATGNPNGHVFPYALSTHFDALADGHNNEHADAPADANAGSHAHAYIDLAFDDL